MSSSSTFIGNLVNYGEMPTGGTQVYHIDGTAKRARVVERNNIVCTVIDPKKKGMDGFVMIASSGRGMAPPHLTFKVEFNIENNPCFWQLWVRFDGMMLRKKDEAKPFTDLQASLMTMKDRTFYLCDWTPEHETLRAELAVLKYTQSLRLIDEEVRKAQQELDRHVERRAKCAALLEEAQKK